MAICLKIEKRAFTIAIGLYLSAALLAYISGKSGFWSVGKVFAMKPLEPAEILVHNLLVATILWSGIFLMGIPSALFLLFNAIVHGFSIGRSSESLPALWPYGLFELTALWIAAGVGLARGVALAWHTTYPIKCALRWIPVCILLLIIAAYLEAARL